mmetsp:Transcript_46229/g.122556  ORF Transcript_46229/g.122556 Transcript_46229/m.122556 type:complete len:221 (-) Transcript_46229:7-669(-)
MGCVATNTSSAGLSPRIARDTASGPRRPVTKCAVHWRIRSAADFRLFRLSFAGRPEIDPVRHLQRPLATSLAERCCTCRPSRPFSKIAFASNRHTRGIDEAHGVDQRCAARLAALVVVRLHGAVTFYETRTATSVHPFGPLSQHAILWRAAVALGLRFAPALCDLGTPALGHALHLEWLVAVLACICRRNRQTEENSENHHSFQPLTHSRTKSVPSPQAA